MPRAARLRIAIEIADALEGEDVIIEPFAPMEGLLVAFFLKDEAVIEYMQFREGATEFRDLQDRFPRARLVGGDRFEVVAVSLDRSGFEKPKAFYEEIGIGNLALYNDASARIGTDFRFGLGSAFTLDATINPDFGQVEADPAVINLSAFDTRVEERRPFFGIAALDFTISARQSTGR